MDPATFNIFRSSNQGGEAGEYYWELTSSIMSGTSTCADVCLIGDSTLLYVTAVAATANYSYPYFVTTTLDGTFIANWRENNNSVVLPTLTVLGMGQPATGLIKKMSRNQVLINCCNRVICISVSDDGKTITGPSDPSNSPYTFGFGGSAPTFAAFAQDARTTPAPLSTVTWVTRIHHSGVTASDRASGTPTIGTAYWLGDALLPRGIINHDSRSFIYGQRFSGNNYYGVGARVATNSNGVPATTNSFLSLIGLGAATTGAYSISYADYDSGSGSIYTMGLDAKSLAVPVFSKIADPFGDSPTVTYNNYWHNAGSTTHVYLNAAVHLRKGFYSSAGGAWLASVRISNANHFVYADDDSGAILKEFAFVGYEAAGAPCAILRDPVDPLNYVQIIWRANAQKMTVMRLHKKSMTEGVTFGDGHVTWTSSASLYRSSGGNSSVTTSGPTLTSLSDSTPNVAIASYLTPTFAKYLPS